MDLLRMRCSGPVSGEIRPPGSKSITNRALVCASLAKGRSVLRGVLHSDDTRVMIESWRRLGVSIETTAESNSLVVEGCSGTIAPGPIDLYAENSGTTIRFMAAVAALGDGEYRLTGNARMQKRPIEDLLLALRQTNINAKSLNDNGCPPITITTHGLAGGDVTIAGDTSSQFLSGLLLAAPCAKNDFKITLSTPLISEPYVEMTQQVMQAFGAPSQRILSDSGTSSFQVAHGGYLATNYAIEPDASAASYFFAAAAITGGKVTVHGLGSKAIQGDMRFVECLRQMGCQVILEEYRSSISACQPDGKRVALRGIDITMSHISDTVQTLAVVALFAEGETVIRGVGHIRHKESDRIGDLARELRKVGATVEEFSDGMKIIPGKLSGARLSTYDDHRMAMSFALIGLAVDGILIEDPGCTSKTYPHFFTDLASVCRLQ
jgi:3-phosphoshikimate 1-carboxyvinyltransferase